MGATRRTISQTPEEMRRITMELLEANLALLDPDDDYQIVHCVTGGGSSAPYIGGGFRKATPTVLIHCEPVVHARFARFYSQGAHLIVSTVRHIPPQVLDPHIKHRSRQHFVLADLEVKQQHPDAFALLLDMAGNIAEGIGSNLFIVSGGVIRTPDDTNILLGIGRQTALDLASSLDMETREVTLKLEDVLNADEVFMTSTPYSLLPVVRVNGSVIGTGQPGPMTMQILDAWKEMVGVDFVEQAVRRSAMPTVDAPQAALFGNAGGANVTP
jgi:branched-chain amino acid aminotransferase